MGGGLISLVSVGQQDFYLTSTPEITFFKVKYRRYSLFAIESIQQTFSGSVDFGRKLTATVSRNADLIWKTYLQVDLPTLTAPAGKLAKWVNELGHVMIDYAEIQIGGQRIDRQYGIWLSIWNSLTLPAEKTTGYNQMIGNTSTMTTAASSIAATTIYIPLQFWFNRNIGLALPLIALQYHDVKFEINLRQVTDCYIVTDTSGVTLTSGNTISPAPSLSDASLYIDYIYLDNEERKRFAQNPHEYLIEQLQVPGTETYSNSNVVSKVNLNHPVKEIIWTVQLQSNYLNGVNKWLDFDNSGDEPVTTAQLKLNNQDRFASRAGFYFSKVQPYQHHTDIPTGSGIYVYSFAIYPEDHQPSGTTNFSRIDNASLNLTLGTGSSAVDLSLYATNYNVLRCKSGLGGLAYSS
jgi:hypothetical protein